jgi:hypothetical protein
VAAVPSGLSLTPWVQKTPYWYGRSPKTLLHVEMLWVERRISSGTSVIILEVWNVFSRFQTWEKKRSIRVKYKG